MHLRTDGQNLWTHTLIRCMSSSVFASHDAPLLFSLLLIEGLQFDHPFQPCLLPLPLVYSISLHYACLTSGLLVAPWVCVNFGWRSLFFVFGGLGFVWCAWWAWAALWLPQPDTRPASDLTMAKPKSSSKMDKTVSVDSSEAKSSGKTPVPFRSILSNRVVWGLCICHFIFGE